MFVKVILRFFFIMVNSFITIPSFLVWVFMFLPVRFVAPALYYEMEATLFHWMQFSVSHWMQSAGYTVVESGANVSNLYKDEALVICNHQSTADVPTLIYCFSHKKGIAGHVMWIMDMLFKYTHFGWVSYTRGDFFILQGTKQGRSNQMELLEKHMNSLYQERPRKWIVLFPEGGFLRKRRERSQKFAKENDLPVLQHVALPRLGAMQVLINNLHPKSPTGQRKTLKWVIDITIGYPKAKALDMQTIIGGWRPPLVTHVHYRVIPIHDVPLKEEQLTQWLYEKFKEKEELLEYFYQNDCFKEFNENLHEGSQNNTRPLKFSLVHIWMYHAFYLGLAVCQFYIIKSLLYTLF